MEMQQQPSRGVLRKRCDDDMRADPSDLTLSSLSFPFIDTKSPNLA